MEFSNNTKNHAAMINYYRLFEQETLFLGAF